MQSNPSPAWTRCAEAFGALLKRRRTELGLTQKQLVVAAGITKDHHISEMEHGRRKPTRAQLDRLCAALDLDHDEAHATLGLIPMDVEAAWLESRAVRMVARTWTDRHERIRQSTTGDRK